MYVVIVNVLEFSHTNDCYFSHIPNDVRIKPDFWWIVLLLFMVEFITDILTWVFSKFLVKIGLIKKEFKITFVMLTTKEIFLQSICFAYFTLLAFIYGSCILFVNICVYKYTYVNIYR